MRAGHRPVRQSHPLQRRFEDRQGDVNSWPLLQMEEAPMTGPAQPRRRGSYGIDAPYWAAALVVLIVAELALAIMSGKMWSFLPVVLLLVIFGSALYTTLRGKFVVWAELLDKLELRGDEGILDMGCGR